MGILVLVRNSVGNRSNHFIFWFSILDLIHMGQKFVFRIISFALMWFILQVFFPPPHYKTSVFTTALVDISRCLLGTFYWVFLAVIEYWSRVSRHSQHDSKPSLPHGLFHRSLLTCIWYLVLLPKVRHDLFLHPVSPKTQLPHPTSSIFTPLWCGISFLVEPCYFWYLLLLIDLP